MRRAGAIVVLAAFLSACGGSDYRAPVEDRRGSTHQKVDASAAPDRYDVRSGDTLYAIAFRYGKDFRQLAAANNIRSPYTIYPGQRLYMNRPAPMAAAVTQSAQPETPSPRPSSNTVTTGGSAAAAGAQAAAKKPSSKPGSAQGSSVLNGGGSSWQWPTSGAVTRGFSSTVHKGIDIGGKRGDAVKAASNGKIVYAGNGIVGFGELIIIKHSETYLSAYGHNHRLLVAEGEAVRQGQKIAEKGSSGTNAVKLHFEIRREGKPVNPVALLPPR